MPRLREEFDIEELPGGAQALRTVVCDEEEPQPVIVTLKSSIEDVMDHAVVVIGIEQDEGQESTTVAFMDPLTGRIERDATGLFWQSWNFAGRRAFVLRP